MSARSSSLDTLPIPFLGWIEACKTGCDVRERECYDFDWHGISEMEESPEQLPIHFRGRREADVYLITKRFTFSASHVLMNLPAEHPCSRLHGHNYAVELVLGSSQLDEMGFVVDYRRLDPFKQYLQEKLDHRHLNDVMIIQPSAELIAWALYTWCVENMDLPIVERLVAVRVRETPNTSAEYRRE